jgi:hypothetical protein
VSVVSPEGSLTLPSGRALVSYFSVVYPPLLWSVTDYTPAFPAAAARQTLNSLFAVLVGVAEILHPSTQACGCSGRPTREDEGQPELLPIHPTV